MLRSWKALTPSNGWELQTRPTMLFRPGIAEFDLGHAQVGLRAAAGWPSIMPLETNGDQRQGSGVDVLNSDQSMVGDFGFKGSGPEIVPTRNLAVSASNCTSKRQT